MSANRFSAAAEPTFRRRADTARVSARSRSTPRPLASEERPAPSTVCGRALAIATLCALAPLAACGCGGGHPTASGHYGSGHAASDGGAALTLRLSSARTLPAPVQLPAVAAVSGGVLVLGGLDAGEASTANMVLIDQSGARAVGRLPLALHDAAAASIEGQAYYFGGGGAGGASGAIFRVGPASASLAGQLPVGASDVGAATVGHSAYIVGGYTEIVALRTIVAYTPPSGVRVAGTLPQPLRYAAVAAVGGKVLIAGGTSGEAAQQEILSFDPATGVVRQIGTLPYPLTHAAGGSLGGRLLVFGGRGSERTSQRAEILSIDPSDGSARRAGSLPRALSDLGAASLGTEVALLGGRDRSGTVHDQVLTYRAR